MDRQDIDLLTRILHDSGLAELTGSLELGRSQLVGSVWLVWPEEGMVGMGSVLAELSTGTVRYSPTGNLSSREHLAALIRTGAWRDDPSLITLASRSAVHTHPAKTPQTAAPSEDELAAAIARHLEWQANDGDEPEPVPDWLRNS